MRRLWGKYGSIGKHRRMQKPNLFLQLGSFLYRTEKIFAGNKLVFLT
jgi:hypothetical protein